MDIFPPNMIETVSHARKVEVISPHPNNNPGVMEMPSSHGDPKCFLFRSGDAVDCRDKGQRGKI